MRPTRYQETVEIVPGVQATSVDAGHILGSSPVVLEWNEGSTTKRLAFSGDVGRSGLAIIGDQDPSAGADAIILESTYGNRDHASVDDAKERLAGVVRNAAARGGRVLVPAFAVGRTQELVYDLHEPSAAGRIPPVPIVIDSPLASKAMDVFERNTNVFDATEPLVRAYEGRCGEMFQSTVAFSHRV